MFCTLKAHIIIYTQMDSAFLDGFWPCGGEKVFSNLSTWSWTTTQVCVCL